MSFDNAINQRGQMNVTYNKMLKEETDPKRIEDIKKQIKLNDEEIIQLRQGKPLFGTAKPLKQETTIIEADPETKGQKITKLDEAGNPTPPPEETTPEETIPEETTETIVEEPTSPSKKVGNKLRDILQSNASISAEESLKAKVAAAKAAKNNNS